MSVLPRVSVAEQPTGVVAMEKTERDAGSQVGATAPSTTSVALAVLLTVAPPGPVASVITSAGRCSQGGVRSATVAVNPPVALLPWTSAAEHDTGVASMGKVDPEAGAQCTSTAPSTTSVAVAM